MCEPPLCGHEIFALSREYIGSFEYFICGGFGGMCTVLSGHPFDTIKVRLQTMEAGDKAAYKGPLDCFKKMIKREGFFGLYKGMTAPLTAVAPIFALNFFGYSLGKNMIANYYNSLKPVNERIVHPYLTEPWQYLVAGSFSAIITTVFMAPGERIKVLLQIQDGTHEKKYNGMLDCLRKLYKEGGMRSIYRGTGATLARDIPSTGGYFLAYEMTKNYFTDYGKKEMKLAYALLGGVAAGVTFWLIGMPVDVMKSRLQAAPDGTYPRGIRDVFLSIIKNEPITTFYKGLTPVLIRAGPANAATFFGFELMRRVLVYLFH